MIKELLVFIGTPVLRSVGGWLQKSLEDKKIKKYEWLLLLETITRVGLIQVFAYIGFSVAGVDNSVLASGVTAFLADKLFGALKENKNVK